MTKEKRIAQFLKVDREKFEKEYKKLNGDLTKDKILSIYEDIIVPKRATSKSAGYDFFSPFSFELYPNESIMIPTGICITIADGWFLQCCPKSGLGTKYRMQLDNTVGIIDGDYFYSDNGGHIFAKITNNSNENKVMSIKKGDGFMQGILLRYGITVDDLVTTKRNGGFGSTDNKGDNDNEI